MGIDLGLTAHQPQQPRCQDTTEPLPAALPPHRLPGFTPLLTSTLNADLPPRQISRVGPQISNIFELQRVEITPLNTIQGVFPLDTQKAVGPGEAPSLSPSGLSPQMLQPALHWPCVRLGHRGLWTQQPHPPPFQCFILSHGDSPRE